jgi:hypothetical protein
MQLAIVQDFVTHYVPCVGFGYAFWAIAPKNYPVGKTTPFFLKLVKFFKGAVRLENEHI